VLDNLAEEHRRGPPHSHAKRKRKKEGEGRPFRSPTTEEGKFLKSYGQQRITAHGGGEKERNVCTFRRFVLLKGGKRERPEGRHSQITARKRKEKREEKERDHNNNLSREKKEIRESEDCARKERKGESPSLLDRADGKGKKRRAGRVSAVLECEKVAYSRWVA